MHPTLTLIRSLFLPSLLFSLPFVNTFRKRRKVVLDIITKHSCTEEGSRHCFNLFHNHDI